MGKILKYTFFLLLNWFYINSNEILNGTLVTINGEQILLSDINETKNIHKLIKKKILKMKTYWIKLSEISY